MNQYLTSQGTGMADCADFREDCAYNRTGWSEEQLSLVRKRVSSRARERHVMSAVPRLRNSDFSLPLGFSIYDEARRPEALWKWSGITFPHRCLEIRESTGLIRFHLPRSDFQTPSPPHRGANKSARPLLTMPSSLLIDRHHNVRKGQGLPSNRYGLHSRLPIPPIRSTYRSLFEHPHRSTLYRSPARILGRRRKSQTFRVWVRIASSRQRGRA